jgi:hypothetical protein
MYSDSADGADASPSEIGSIETFVPKWIESSFCDTSRCVSVATLDGNLVGIRDTKQSDGPILTYTRDEWNAFVQGVRSGDFDTI